MDTILAKFLVAFFVCQLVSFTASVPLKDAHNQSRHKRSPDNGFSFFGIKPSSFSVPNPITSAQQTFDSFRNFLTPTAGPSRNRNSEKENHNPFHDKKPAKEIYVNPTQTQDTNLNQQRATLPPEMFTTSKTLVQNVEPNKYDANIVHKQKDKAIDPVDDNGEDDTRSKDKNIDKNAVDIKKIDKTILDAIFKDTIDSTTSEYSTDYTTETGDYETTTNVDDLLRIPPAVVASLLG